VTKVPRAKTIPVLATFGVLLVAGAARAQTISFTHAISIYEDEKNGALKQPEGVGCTDDGRLVVADSGNGRLVEFSFKGGQVSGGREVKLSQIRYPVRVQIDGKGNVLVLDRKTWRIGRVDANGAFLGYVEPQGVPDPAAVLVGGPTTCISST
jgi:sugar lactone lactonase YvrE